MAVTGRSTTSTVLALAVVFVLALVLVHGCGAASSTAARPQVVPLRVRVAKLERQVHALSIKVKKLQAAVCPQFPPVCSPKPKKETP